MILCPAQSIIYFHCLIVRFQEIILLIDPYKYEKLVPEDKMLLEMMSVPDFAELILLLNMVESLISV